jgi:5-(carboxyamino)imidazole ribonucleotide synthase
VGILAVELFWTGGRLLVNELAARPHNTGHHTIEAAVTSQFENHLRAVLDLPLGDPSTVSPSAMVNVVGGPVGADPRGRLGEGLAADPGAHVHLYGKAWRPGRKLGHVTVCDPDPERALQRARRVVANLVGPEVAP